MPYPDTAEGFQVHDTKNWSTFKKGEFKLKPFEAHDVDIAIDACGVCGSDVHTITGGWGDVILPLVVGHEVVGRVLRTGPSVTHCAVGDRVGVGAQVGADLTCDLCKADAENYCPNQIDTYGAEYPDGTISQGGYASHIRAHEYFVFKIPEALETSLAAPMLCAGITVFSPLKRLGAGPGKRIGVVGIGGLGHFAVLFAKALGAEVYALSHSPSKKDDALKLGATGFITTNTDDWADPWKYKFDMLLNTANATDKFNLPAYFSTLKPHGVFHNVGMPEEPLHELRFQDFVTTGCYMGTSHIGNRPEMLEMLDLAAKAGVKSWVETIDVGEAGCKEAVERVKNNKVRYRFTLVNYDKAFGKRE
ncbi:NADPH-dependent medium chain alcohol dehydrogenase [Eremomyces bilateralis CBS 781.70]|uniref:alcohol dehydrogenase (NADP(+)) n=1 Tax=Eremomyces bilateralis CBS 781.70 TaxID=1392243 RepID=A0A6G1FS78_9PEZI|nr:NADPH-dependent medium chain alcohol dehydrogenase [Eremomyces bilateralis CBS 781.70]KAF1808541.1 NADPH-dependent medium chain alcohol dehydrogenase [Eremomyces bilateralis CBS 781.70]